MERDAELVSCCVANCPSPPEPFGQRCGTSERPILDGGTDGSNPVPSSGESGANLAFSAMAPLPRGDAPPIVSNECCQDLRPFQPLSCRHGIVDPVISPKQNGFLEDEGCHLPDFSISTRTEPLPEGTRRSLSRGGAAGTDAEIGMQTSAEPFERLFRAFQGQHGLRFRHRRRNLFEKLHRPALRGELRLAPEFVIFGRNDTANGFDNDEAGALLLDPGSIRCSGKPGDERREKLVAHPVHHEIVEVNGIFGHRTGKAVRKTRDIPDLPVLETGGNHGGLVYADISALVRLLVRSARQAKICELLKIERHRRLHGWTEQTG